MKIGAIILFAFIYVGAIVSCVIHGYMPRKYKLFGVTYGDSFKELDRDVQIKKAIVTALVAVFSILHFVLPIYTLFKRWTPIDHPFWFVVVYIITCIVWLFVFTNDNGGKRHYVDKIKEILNETPIYVETKRIIKEHPEYIVTLPCADGVAFFEYELPKKLAEEPVPQDWLRAHEHEYKSFDKMVDDWCEQWEEQERARWTSVEKTPYAAKIVAADFGINTLNEEDMENMLKYLSEDEELHLKKKNHKISKCFTIDYVVTKTTERTVGIITERTVKNSDETTHGYSTVELGILVREKEKN